MSMDRGKRPIKMGRKGLETVDFSTEFRPILLADRDNQYILANWTSIHCLLRGKDTLGGFSLTQDVDEKEGD